MRDLSKRRRCAFFDELRDAYRHGYKPHMSAPKPHAQFAKEDANGTDNGNRSRYSAKRLLQH